MSDTQTDMPRLCSGCGCDIGDRHGLAKWCLKCQSSSARYGCKKRRPAVHEGQNRAHQFVYRAIQKGLLPRAETLKCFDCDNQAAHYDHRDYNKPLDVEPVCRSCNSKRGPALPLLAEMIESPAEKINRLETELAAFRRAA